MCEVSGGVYKPPGAVRFESIDRRDPSLLGAKFRVDRRTGRVTGLSLFSNADHRIVHFRNVQDIRNALEVTAITATGDTQVLSISEFEGRMTFAYFVGWHALALAGSCKAD